MTMHRASTAARKILVVDDDRALRHALTTLLRRAGFSVSGAGEGKLALRRLQTNHYDLALLDVGLPGMNGLEVLAQIAGKSPRPKVIIMTTDGTPPNVLRAVREQAYRFITKPFPPDSIVEMVENAMECDSPAPIEVLSALPHWVELAVPCDLQTVDRIQNFMIQLKGDLSLEMRESIGQAFREMLHNAVEWGGELDPTRKVHISYLRTPRLLMYRIADPGPGFRLETLKHAAINNPPEEPYGHLAVRDAQGIRPGGFGIMLVKATMDELLYNEK